MNVPLKIIVFGVLADIDETARADDLVAEAADIDVARLVDLGEGQKGEIEAAAVVEIELVGLIDHRLIVARQRPARCRLPARRRSGPARW